MATRIIMFENTDGKHHGMGLMFFGPDPGHATQPFPAWIEANGLMFRMSNPGSGGPYSIPSYRMAPARKERKTT